MQIGLALLYEQIIKNRVEWKKDKLFGSFLGFIRSEDKEHFELERIFTTISNIDIESFNSLYEAIKMKKIGYDYIIEDKEIEHMRPPVLSYESYEKDTKEYGDYVKIKSMNVLGCLMSLGLIYLSSTGLDGSASYNFTDFAFKLVNYIETH
jgi:hypothetical protein